MTEGAIEPPSEEEESKGAPSDEGTYGPKKEELRDKAVATAMPPPPPPPERPTMTGGAVRPCDGAFSAAEDEEVYDDRAAESPSTTADEAVVGAPEVAAKPEKGFDGSGTTAAAAATSTSTSVAADMPPSPAIVVGQTRCRDAAGYVGTIYFDGMIPTSSTISGSGSSSATTTTTKVKAKRYYGVVWDDPTRGRHDGSAVDPTTKRLVRYMKVSPVEHENGSHPTASSFVVPSKLDLGKPLSFELLLERYVRRHRPSDGENHVVLCAGNSRHDSKDVKTKPIELVGMEKIVAQQQLETLSTVSMRFMGINHVPEIIFSVEEAGECDDDTDHSSQALLGRRLRHCTHVDVAGNLLTDWNDLKRLLKVLPDLKNVSVAHNRFVDATMKFSSSNPNGAWSHQLVRLNMSKCNLRTSRTLVDLCRALPSLVSLCCAHADLRDLEAVVRELSASHSGDDINSDAAKTTGFANVVELDVTSCQLTSELLRSLSALFPGVSTLNLTNNAVEVWPQDPVFPQLTHLQWTLSSPQQQASSIDATATDDSRHSDLMQKCLKHLVEAYHDQLISLRIELAHPGPTSSSSLSSFAGSSSSVVPAPCKLLLIACLGRLQLWNASHISSQERKDAEVYLLRHVDRDGYATRPGGAAGGTRDDSSTPRLLIKCPRYDELVARHPNALQQAQSLGGIGTPGSLMNLVTVEFRSLCPHSCDRPPVIRKLPVTLTLGRLKSMLARHFDLDADLQALSWVVASEPTTTSASRTAGRRPDQALPTPLNEHDDSTLEQCGLVHGAIVFMNEREISPREKENHHRAMLERKIEQQEHDLAEFERRKRALAGGAM